MVAVEEVWEERAEDGSELERVEKWRGRMLDMLDLYYCEGVGWWSMWVPGYVHQALTFLRLTAPRRQATFSASTTPAMATISTMHSLRW
jgi:hypothetical protein